MEKPPAEPGRLLKVIVPVDVVRSMDRAILASNGAYQDRAEFVTEAIRDRLAEDTAVHQPEVALLAPSNGVSTSAHHVVPQSMLEALRLGQWIPRSTGSVPVGPTDLTNFGLHNRDLPTLWALDQLALLGSQQSDGVPWDELIDRVRSEGARLGEMLRIRDTSRPTLMPAGIGFPRPGPKQARSVARFVAANVGVNNGRAEGPFFVLALAKFVDQDRTRISPSDDAVDLLRSLIEAGIGDDLPHPEPAFRAWWAFLTQRAPAEHEAWTKVLQVVDRQPTRTELVAAFPEWKGSTADTNTTGFVSRSREWGLIEPGLSDQQRYRLTSLGQAVLGGIES
jgi:Arc/MetJ-type ribon-helix-helix transcriptional regulator